MRRAANPARARQMAAYLKTDDPFYGISSPDCHRLFRAALAEFPIESREDWEGAIRALWQSDRREDKHQALRVAEIKTYRTPGAFPVFARLVHEASWWDTLDWIASKLVGLLVLEHREYEPEVAGWVHSDHLWTRRASLLAHLKHKRETNVELVERTILLLAHEKEFFIRKAIGWVLREYSKTDAQWVRAFVSKNEDVLAPLSQREALKWLARQSARGGS